MLPPFARQQAGGPILMSFSFLFLGPFVSGLITVYRKPSVPGYSTSTWIFAPWITIAASMLVALCAAWEGIICVVFIAPPALLSASLGGIAAGLWHKRASRQASTAMMSCFALTPLLLAIVEVYLHQPLVTRTVTTQVQIAAPVNVIWSNIERVPAIAPGELRSSWANAIGFPRPVEATLSHQGVGGIRNASFERGLRFTETVTDWRPLRRLAFTIQADTANIPPATLDEHVTVGGRFFDVLTGEYEIEPQQDGTTILHLASRERLSTDFNFYAALWSDAVMRDMQNNILHVIRNRCEAQSRAQFGVQTSSLHP